MPDTEGELQRLRQEVAAVRRERLDRARKVASRPVLERAIAEAERDVDAMTSGEVERLRIEAEQLMQRLRKAWADTDWIRLALLRIQAVGVNLDDLAHTAQMATALDSEAQGRATFAAAVADVGLAVRVPPVLTLDLPDHPNKEQIAQAMQENRDFLAEREARRAKPTVRREPDRHAR